jgi:hypothetical protein
MREAPKFGEDDPLDQEGVAQSAPLSVGMIRSDAAKSLEKDKSGRSLMHDEIVGGRMRKRTSIEAKAFLNWGCQIRVVANALA